MASQGSTEQIGISSEDDSNIKIITVDKTYRATYDHLVYSSLTMEAIRETLIQFADNAADELYEMASSGSPLWGHDDLDEEFLNQVVYRERFMSNIKHRKALQGLKNILHGAVDGSLENSLQSMMNTETLPLTLEASRSSDTVHKNPTEVVGMLMDVEQWLEMFPNIISNASSLGKVFEDGYHDGSLNVMKAEYGIPTPYPITRECYFIRRSKKVDDRRWLIVDVSLDLPGLKYYRKPSGCLIEQLDGSGFSKVTWVEHNEVFLERCPSVLFKELAESGFAFTAGRWTTMLKYKAESEHLIKQYISVDGAGRSNMLRLAHRMSQLCTSKMNASTKKTWSSRKSMGNDEYIFSNRECFENNPGRPNGNVITVAASILLPFDADKLYDSLQCVECRPKWDISILGACAKEELHITFGDDSSTYVSVLNVKIPGMEPIKCLQACFLNSVSMYMMWTFLHKNTMNAIMQGDDPDAIGILVSGAAVFPKDPTIEDGGSILTLLFECLEEHESSVGHQVLQDALYQVITKTLTTGIITCTPC